LPLLLAGWLSLSLAQAAPAAGARDVVLIGQLTDEEVVQVTAALAASDDPGVVLLDSPKSGSAMKQFLKAYHANRVRRLGNFSRGIVDLDRRLGCKTEPLLKDEQAGASLVWRTLLPRAERAVVSPATPRSLLLQAACLAGVMKAPLVITRGNPGDLEDLQAQLRDLKRVELLACGDAVDLCQKLTDHKIRALPDEKAVMTAYMQHQRRRGAIRNLVVTNPADTRTSRGKLSLLAPWVALEHRAVLLCTNEAGTDTAEVVRAAQKYPELARAESLTLVAGLKAIPPEQRPNPVPGKDAVIEMEPLTPTGSDPFSYATGRLFHDDLGVFSLMLARPRLLAATTGAARQALVVSNPGGGLSLLETFSRHTTNELRNGGYLTKARFDEEVTPGEVRRLMPGEDIFLWEGHYRTMVDKFEMPKWDEPLPSSLIFLQSCLALNEAEGQPLFQRGALGIVGSSTRTFSASGGAFTLGFFDGLIYDDQTLGGALRQSKNFLLVYSLLKKNRLGDKAKLSGANLRSAWAFTLWGDPTLKLPQPPRPADVLAPVRAQVQGNVIILTLPPTTYPLVEVKQYHASMRPNARMAGLLTKEGEQDDRRLVPFLFAEVPLPHAPYGQVPRLTSRIPSRNWAFIWDERRLHGYLLVEPRPKDETEVRFHVHWR
jgi:hypothetical protein